MKGNYKHCKAHTKLYKRWTSMKNRCYNKKDPRYNDWGGRGIVVCNEWKDDFEAFYNWSINNGYQDDLSIDRIDNNKGYSPDNCQWVDRKIQNRNTRRNHYITINGETHCISEWCDILGLKYTKIIQRINRHHWPIKQALEFEERHYDTN